MTPVEIGFASIGVIVLGLYFGVPIVVALAGTSFVGVMLIRGDIDIAISVLSIAASDTIASYIFGVIPLFVLMGMLVNVAGVGRDTFLAANQLFGRIAGGLGLATVAANAVFAAVTGVSIASAAVFTRVAVPEMVAAGYDRRFAVGIVAGSSILGMLIPPSLLLIVFAVITEQSIGALFIAAIVPGAIMAAAFGFGIVAMVLRNRNLVGREESRNTERLPLGQVLRMVLPILTLVTLIMGGIYGGFYTATEAGGIGAFAALILALLRRSLSPKAFWGVLVETGHVTAAICMVVIAAGMYSRMLALSGLPTFVGNWFSAADMGFAMTLFLYLLVIVALGAILDSMSILLILVPLAFPVFVGFGVDPIWFGIVTIVAVEIGIITPPFGIGCFVVKDSLPDKTISLEDVFVGAFPFVVLMLLVLALLALFPVLSTILL
ncbi:MAG: TRAP transporter large permease [Thalassovita sp.]